MTPIAPVTLRPGSPLPTAARQSGTVAPTPLGLDEQLLLAIEAQNLGEIRSLLAAGTNVAKSQQPLILLAIEPRVLRSQGQNTIKVLELLLAAGANIDAQSGTNNWTPLMMAAVNRDHELVKYLILNKANTTLNDANGHTVFGLIHSLNKWDHNEVKCVLVQSTADGKAWLESAASEGFRRANTFDDKAPRPAIGAETSWVLQEVLAYGEDNQVNQICRWVENGGDVNWRDLTYGWTVLHLAAQCGNEKMIRYLLAHGANIEARDKRDGTPLMLACNVEFSAVKLSSSIVGLLLDSGANPNATDRDGNTALGLIRRSPVAEAEKIAQLLSSRGAAATPGKDSACPECGAPYSEGMAKRGVHVTFSGAFAEFACLECNERQQASLESIDKAKGAQVMCSCRAIAFVPPSVWCKACGQGLSNGWQSTLQKVR